MSSTNSSLSLSHSGATSNHSYSLAPSTKSVKRPSTLCGYALFLFTTGEQFYAPGFRVGTDGPATEGLARIAAKAEFGTFSRLLRHLRAIEPDYSGPVYPLTPEKAMVGDGKG